MKVALLVFLIIFSKEAAAVEECLRIPSFKYEDEDGKLLGGQCKPSQTRGAFYTDDSKAAWECLDAKSPWPSQRDIKQKTKKGETKQEFAGLCKFGGFESKLKKQDIPICRENPLQCAPGPKLNWGACVAQDIKNWKCIPLEDDIDEFIKGDCLALPVVETTLHATPALYNTFSQSVVSTDHKELHQSVCRFATDKDAGYPWKVKADPAFSPCGGACEHGTAHSRCFSVKGPGIAWIGTDRHRQEEGGEASPCEWTLVDPAIAEFPNRKWPEFQHNGPFFDGECLCPTHKDYADAPDWSTVADGPRWLLQEKGGIGKFQIALLIFLMLAAGGGGFLFWQRTKQTRPRQLTGGLMR